MTRFAAIVSLCFAVGCSDYPFILTDGLLPDSGPEPGPPHQVHFCLLFGADTGGNVTEDVVEKLCANYPYAWGDSCKDNENLQSCPEFVTSLLGECPNLDTCDYEECSKALQTASCGEWPQACDKIVKCEQTDSTPGIPPKPPAPTTGEIESTGEDGSSTGESTNTSGTGTE